MATTRALAAIISALVALGCEAGDNSIVRAFHPTVTAGSTLSDAILRAEQAQKADTAFTVEGTQCPGDTVAIGRSVGHPYVRVLHVASKPASAPEPGYTEQGFPTREALAGALAEHLPTFYGCRTFVFRFDRDYWWITTDSFSVTVDPQGRIESVSDLKEDELGE